MRALRKAAPLVGAASLLFAAVMLFFNIRAWDGGPDVPDGLNALFAAGFVVAALTWLFSTIAGPRLESVDAKVGSLEANQNAMNHQVKQVAQTLGALSDLVELLNRQVMANTGLMTAVPAEYQQNLEDIRELLGTSYRALFADAVQAVDGRPTGTADRAGQLVLLRNGKHHNGS